MSEYNKDHLVDSERMLSGETDETSDRQKPEAAEKAGGLPPAHRYGMI